MDPIRLALDSEINPLIEKAQIALLARDLRHYLSAFESVVKMVGGAYKVELSMPGATPLEMTCNFASSTFGHWYSANYNAAQTWRRFDGQPVLVRDDWERTQALLPEGSNYFTSSDLKIPSVVVLGDDILIGADRHLHISHEEWDALSEYLNSHNLLRNLLKFLRSEPKPEAALREGAGFGKAMSLDAVLEKVAAWFPSAGQDPEDRYSAFFTTLYTLFPFLTISKKARPRGKDPTPRGSLVVVCIPFPETRPPDIFGTVIAAYRLERDIESFQVDVIEKLRHAFGPVIARFIGLEAEHLAGIDSRGNLAIERSVGQFQFVTSRVIRKGDRLEKWRDRFPPADNDAPWDPDYKHWAVPLWGCSDRMRDLCELLERHLTSRGPAPAQRVGLQTAFFHSGPGCGKETIAKLCHYLSVRSHDEEVFDEVIVPNLKDIERRIGGEEPLSRILGRDFNGFGDGQSLKARKPWDFNYFVFDCGKHERGSVRAALTEAVLKTAAVCGTLFIDELNVIDDPREMDIFLRLCEGKKLIEGELLGQHVILPMNVLLVFAGNSSPTELVEAGWNPALFSRIASRTFRIPSLRERPEDIPLAFAYQLEVESMGRMEHVDFSAMKLLAALPWKRGNFRDLRTLVREIMDHRSTHAEESTEIEFSEVIEALQQRELFG